jgi:hypothetical protein
VLLHGLGKQRLIAVDADDMPVWADSTGNPRSDCACPATYIQNRQTRAKVREQPAMVVFERSAAKNSRVGTMGLLAQMLIFPREFPLSTGPREESSVLVIH